MVNSGYSVRFYMTRKEYMNSLVKRFPPSPSVNHFDCDCDCDFYYSIYIVSIGSRHEKNIKIDK